MDDRNSNEEYIRSWLEEAPEPDPQDAAAEGGHRLPGTLDPTEPPPSAVIVNPVLRGISTAPGRDAAAEGGHRLPGTLDKPEPPPSKTIDTEALPSMKKPVEDTAGGEGLRPFITELTSAIASLAGNRSEEKPVYHNPAASKVIMTLPNFSGLHTEWLSFRAIYETTRPYFNDVENTARLRRSLRGRALDTVSSELIGNARPDDIMKELELQFGRPDSIAQAETDRLRGLPRCGEAPKDICTFASRVRSGIVTLRALKKEHYLMNAELMRILTEKLPNSLRVQWYKTYTEKYQSTPDLSLFSDFITEQARYCSAFAPPENISEATGLRRVTQRTHTTIDKKPTSKCRICEMDGHRSLDCHKFVKASADKKWELAKQHNMCFRCLRHRQHGHRCQKKRCGIEGCTASHHHLLHYKKKASTTEVAQEAQEIVASSRNHTNQAFLKIVPVQLSGPAGEVRTYALLDDGSTVSLIDEELADMIGAEGPVEPMKIGAISDVTIDTPTSKRVDLTLSTCHRKKIPFRARTIPRLHLSPQSISKDDIADCKHLFDLADQLTYNAGTPKIIIGQDNWHLLLATDIRRGPQHQPIASLTPLGWVLHGARTRTQEQQVHYVNQLNSAEESIDKQLREYFALESLIINPCRPASDPEKRAEDILQRSIVQLEDGRLQTALLWRSDSRTVLTWIRKGARSYKPFVAHRLAAIEENSRVEEWRWVPTKSNIADAATRDVPTHFHTDHEWYCGPKFLYDDPSTWPTESPADSQPTGEEKTVTLIQAGAANLIDVVPDPARFSRWERLLRATARVLQFISLCRKQHTEKTFYKRTKKNKENDPDWSRAVRAPRAPPEAARAQIYTRKFIILDATYIQRAEKLLVRVVQQDAFKQEIASLESNKTVASSSRLYPLRIELNDGVIVLRSRIAAVDKVAKSVKSPPVLDGDHRITQLYIDWTHRSLQHSGTELVVNEVRQHYWIVRLRPTVKQVIARCLHCRIRRARAPTPATGDHPKTRLAHHRRPFTYTGLDYFGPLSVTVGRQHHKRYVALFTCLTTRAVHLEIAHSLSADSAVLALRRFAARRGCPTEIYSDNGTNMHGADRELREAWQEEASRRGIAWRFITPSAPFMGGAWERLVRCVKTALGATLHERHPREEVLATLLCEVEYVVNSRPLTHVSVSGDDDESITPNHFLLGGSARLPSPGTFDERDIDSKKHWRRAQILADMFWRRWVREYLPELQYRREPHARGPALQLGDPVLIADGNLPRNTWPRGRVVAVYPGADGEVRTADVRTAGGILKRPTKKLVPLPK
nr:uncharacterized protein LOC126056280 [Helicoverpa armigera]